ncbi:MAG: dihydrolipoyl dehydrogenase [Planctomycetota bacterium]
MQFQVLVIGGGPGGYVAAIRAAQLGLKVGLIEKENLGGVCLNWGCIPSKALLKAAEYYQQIKHSDEFGITCEKVSFDFNRIVQRSRDIASQMNNGIGFLMKKNNIQTFEGTARLISATEVSIQGKTETTTTKVTSDNIIVSTGARPTILPHLEVDYDRVMTYREAINLRELPKRLAIIGAGAIGAEFAYFFNSFGTEVELIELMDRVLPLEDEEVSKELQKAFKKQGIHCHTSTKVEKLEKSAEFVKVFASKNEKTLEFEVDRVLVAIGMRGNSQDLGLEDLGVTIDRSFIKVDEFMHTGVQGIYAVGDVKGPPLLAHVASMEGIVCVESIAGLNPKPIDSESIPGCTYCQPQVASVGLTEKAARERYGDKIKVGRFPFRASGKAKAMGDTTGFVKVIYGEKYGELLGTHIIGSEAAEMIHEALIAKNLETTHHEILRTIHAHPTLSEAFMEATGNAYDEAINL